MNILDIRYPEGELLRAMKNHESSGQTPEDVVKEFSQGEQPKPTSEPDQSTNNQDNEKLPHTKDLDHGSSNPESSGKSPLSWGNGDPTKEPKQSTEQAEQVDTKIDTLVKENEQLNHELSELKDQYLRKQADFDNFRKRLVRDKEESIQFANKKILEDLVPVIDDFERAIKSSEDSKDFQLLHDGIQLIEKQLVSMLEKKWGLIRFDSLDQEFDPQKHEAVSAEPREGDDGQKVIEEYQKGFLLNDRVLRTAKVKVSMPVVKGD